MCVRISGWKVRKETGRIGSPGRLQQREASQQAVSPAPDRSEMLRPVLGSDEDFWKR